MLTLNKINRVYNVGDNHVEALKNINLEFRKNEFVSVLGHSGCGKTTLLNIIGGLDKYTSGDLIIDGKSTKQYTDKDWDNYRNHSIGFVFQSYNLIPHQTVLENVELALTLSGVSKEERRQRATAVLKTVGLGDKLKNKPSQLSGGQMQRVAIARALVNDPEIILADEPTGALDTTSSVQIMDLLKEISKDRLIIMVTHNPELAEQYSTRIIKLSDGKVIEDSNPYDSKKGKDEAPKKEIVKAPKKRMSFFTAFSLSLKNLLTKKARTILVTVAGSIGIIGIALILAVSSGFNSYVNTMQKSTLSSYPVEITNNDYDMTSLMQIFTKTSEEASKHDSDKVYTKNELTDMLSDFNSSSKQSDLKSFKEYLTNQGKDEIAKYTSAIQYVYDVGINAYYTSEENGLICANPTTIFSNVISQYYVDHKNEMTSDQLLRYGLLNYMFGSSSSYYSNEFWSEMLDNQDLLKDQYELVGENSHWATQANEIMIVINENNEISDDVLYGLGLLNQSDLTQLMDDYIKGNEPTASNKTFEYADLLNMEYKLVLDSDFYEYQDNKWVDIRSNTSDPNYQSKIQNLYNTKGITIKVAGIIKEKADANHSIQTTIGYTSKLTNYIIERNNANTLIQQQLQNDTTNILTGETFVAEPNLTIAEQKANVLNSLGYVDTTSPTSICLYPIDFDAKTDISNFIDKYNQECLANNEKDKIITYSDTIGAMMSTISTIISAISYVLIAFVSVSLVVSSIMIGIITYISVIERTKEIGVLRSIGASKKDVKRVFTAESFIIGLSSGIFGIIVSLILIIPINIILQHYTNIVGLASLPLVGSILLIIISVVLTFIAGLIPAKIAAKRDPVVALKAE